MKHPISFLILLFLVPACDDKKSGVMIFSLEGTAESVFLTHDQESNPIVAWTERKEGALTLLFARVGTDGGSVSSKITLPMTPDVATHPEGMPKVAFKKDGTIIAAYEKKAPTRKNKYASAIYYVMSVDGGRSWTDETFVHANTVAGRSRSYFDIERLPDGEVGASWLDIKLDNGTGGRSVRFARTSPSKGFSHEVLIDSSACQCCRTDVYTDDSENIFVAYRGLMKGAVGKQIRDMMIATSTDHGATFSAPMTISADNWEIDGCPHTGPSLCSNKAGLISLWYTEGSGTGIYYAQKTANENQFSPRQLVSTGGRHPQLSAKGDRIIMLWEENVEVAGKTTTVIHYRIVKDGMNVATGALTSEDHNAFSPVVTHTADGFLAACLMERGDNVGIYLSGF